MATDRASFPVFTPIIENSKEKTPPRYGNGVIVGKLMNVSTTANYTVCSALARHRHRFEYGIVTLGTTAIPLIAASVMFGFEIDSNILREKNMTSIPGGFGYIKRERFNGESKYCVPWIYNITFTPPSDSAITQGATPTFTTPSLTGTAVSDFPAWREMFYFDTFEGAKAFLKCKAGIE